jgi:hypothetical protein
MQRVINSHIPDRHKPKIRREGTPCSGSNKKKTTIPIARDPIRAIRVKKSVTQHCLPTRCKRINPKGTTKKSLQTDASKKKTKAGRANRLAMNESPTEPQLAPLRLPGHLERSRLQIVVALPHEANDVMPDFFRKRWGQDRRVRWCKCRRQRWRQCQGWRCCASLHSRCSCRSGCLTTLLLLLLLVVAVEV